MKNVPSSIYHLQFSEKFTLKEATVLLPYLAKLGIEGIYCSPYFAASSIHGYDTIDPTRLNPQIATPKEYETFCKQLKKFGLYHIADIVPNHMGIKGENLWWQDVLEKGRSSKYAHFFDINWDNDHIDLPILGENGKCEGWILPKNRQHFRLVPWQNGAKKMSYRRFFNINEMVGLRVEDPSVFKAYHKWLFTLLKEKKIDGLRIDHPDGLYDPAAYFERLRKKHKGLIVVEKILGWGEELPSDWKVDGTVGYAYLNHLTGIFVKPENKLTEIYARFIGKKIDFADLVYRDKKFFIETEMLGELKMLAERLHDLFPDHTIEELKGAILEFLARFPVYRSYIRPDGKVPDRDLPYLREAFAKAKPKTRELALLEKIFFLKLDTPKTRDFILRFQQLSAPVMAKGFEDIALYQYNRLLALNEVGGSPDRLGVTKEEFHRFLLVHKEKWPHGFLATSTHDSKRSHDVRMQLSVLAEIPEKWEQALKEWQKCNQPFKTSVDGRLCPDPNAEYMLYQILLGVWPSRPSFQRLWRCFQKSIKEAREYTSWIKPHLPYEKGCEQFLKSILDPKNPFLKSFKAFQREIEQIGKWKTLVSTALHLGSPGIVDIYQGCENWRYLLVDPDNRTVPDYTAAETEKSRLHRKLLNLRKKHKELFLEGDYIPLEVRGDQKECVIAYLRTYRNQACLVAGIRFFASLKSLEGTEIVLPEKTIKADQLFAKAPYAWIFWALKPQKKGRPGSRSKGPASRSETL